MPSTAALLLLPSLSNIQFDAGLYGFASAEAPVSTPVVGPIPMGLAFDYRLWDFDDGGDASFLVDPDHVLGGASHSGGIRLYRDLDGIVRLDRLVVDQAFCSVRIRPELGDGLDLAIIGGTVDQVIAAGDSGSAQWMVYSPVTLTLLGFSNTDMDDDRLLKYYIGVGAGLGNQVTARLIGPFGLDFGVEGEARTFNRHNGSGLNYVRHEVAASGKLGLAVFGRATVWSVGGWGELITQWEPRDDALTRGQVDRQYVAGGLEVTGRFHKPGAPGVGSDVEPVEAPGEGAASGAEG